jgi:hypothetical protein
MNSCVGMMCLEIQVKALMSVFDDVGMYMCNVLADFDDFKAEVVSTCVLSAPQL